VEGRLRRPESAGVAKNAAQVSGLAKAFPGGISGREQRPVRIFDRSAGQCQAAERSRMVPRQLTTARAEFSIFIISVILHWRYADSHDKILRLSGAA
jgi:hypothetical protein